MRAILQRVSQCSIVIDSDINRHIGKGLLVLIGITQDDTSEDIKWLSQKIINMRIFSDLEGKMNLSLQDVKGDIMVVSQFTLFASTAKGNRPSFIQSAKPDIAIPIYEAFLKEITSYLSPDQSIQTGEFGSDMQVTLTNDGPVTIFIDSKNKE